MVQPIPLLQISEASVSNIALHAEGAVMNAASPENCLLSDSLAPGDAAQDELETQLLIEMRYQQHLAQRALQDLFESGEFALL